MSGTTRRLAMLLAWIGVCCAAIAVHAQNEPTTEVRVAPQDELSAQPASPDVALARAETRARAKIREVLTSADFSAEETIRFPVLKKGTDDGDRSDWMKKLEKFFRWLAELLRAGVWILAGLAVLALVFTAHYWWRVASRRVRSATVKIPTHVGGLDIRPESLPDDIGSAARARWLAGDAVGCLSLLYRGVLSVLVSRHEADIHSSYTEAECLRAAKPCLSAAALAYFAALTQTWQFTVYAGRNPDESTVIRLCDEFASHFPADHAGTVAEPLKRDARAAGAA